MFRRPGKNHADENPASSLYKEESPHTSPYKYMHQKNEPPSIFNSSHSLAMEERGIADEMEKTTPLPHHLPGMMKEEQPETTLGEGVTFRGELQFERLLRIDGTFQGELLSQGKVIVGQKGSVKANLNLREAIIEGKVEGNITVQEHLILRGEAIIKGDITAKTLSVDEGVRIHGLVCVGEEVDF